jgi:hypothetical protein
LSIFLEAALLLSSNEFEASKIDFYDRKIYLGAMSHILKTVNIIIDERTTYKADEIIRVYGYERLYVFLLTVITQLYHEM